MSGRISDRQEFLSVRETAEVLGVCQKTVRVMITMQMLRSVILGERLTRIPREDIDRLTKR